MFSFVGEGARVVGALPDLIRLAQPFCLLTSCGVSSVADEREVLVIRAVAQRRQSVPSSSNCPKRAVSVSVQVRCPMSCSRPVTSHLR